MTQSVSGSTAEEAGQRAGQRRAGPWAAFAGFIPWIAYWALIGSVTFRTAVVIAFALSLLAPGLSLLHLERPKVLELGGFAVFLALLAVTFATNDHFLERWIQPLTNAGLLVIALVSLLVGRPFTLEYAEESVPPEVTRRPGFVFINRIITEAWIVAFAVMTVSSLIPPIVEGSATIREGGDTISIAGYWIIPFAALGLAAVFSAKFPGWFVSRLGPAPAPHPPPVPVFRPLDRPASDGARLSVSPATALLDEPFEVLVQGAEPGERVVVEGACLDARGRWWRSHAEAVADSAGVARLGPGPEAAPSLPLIATMRPDDPAADLFLPPPAGQQVAITAAPRGTTLGTVLARHVTGAGVTTEDVDRDGVTGRLFLPPGDGPHPGVALFGGSEGGVESMSQDAGLLASHGYAAFVAGYFGLPGLPAKLAAIPLERLAGSVRWLGAHPAVRTGRLAALAISKGAEGLLAAAAHIGGLRLRAIVAISPSHLTWQAVGADGPEPGVSSWTLDGTGVPFAEVNGGALMPELLRNALLRDRDRRRGRPTLLHLATGYAPPDGGQPDAVIPVERIGAPLLCLTGQADAVWPSAQMASALLTRRRDAPVPVPGSLADQHQSYPAAGHLIRFPYLPTAEPWAGGIALGGSPDGLAAAQADAGPRILRFLADHLGAGHCQLWPVSTAATSSRRLRTPNLPNAAVTCSCTVLADI